MLTLKIVSPDRIEFDGEAQSVCVPGMLGNFEILTGHAPIISSLMAGTVEYVTTQGEKKQVAVTGGFVSVHQNEVSLCVEKEA